jgi:hypothetical protein
MECPECGFHHGYFKHQVDLDSPHWECLCGNQLFIISPQGPFCPYCGLQAAWEDLV